MHADGKRRLSINQARGIHPKICDRFDLTLECIRRFYEGTPSPLANALGWHAPFFELFGDFPGYVNHFLLNDLVTSDYTTVEFLIEFDGFRRSALPASSANEYRDYMHRSMDFIRARNRRIAEAWANRAATDLLRGDYRAARRLPESNSAVLHRSAAVGENQRSGGRDGET